MKQIVILKVNQIKTSTKIKSKPEETKTELHVLLYETMYYVTIMYLRNYVHYETTVELYVKLYEKNVILTETKIEMNNQLKDVVEKVSIIQSQCLAIETRMDERCKIVENTIKKAFIEQVNSMEWKIREHFSKYKVRVDKVEKNPKDQIKIRNHD